MIKMDTTVKSISQNRNMIPKIVNKVISNTDSQPDVPSSHIARQELAPGNRGIAFIIHITHGISYTTKPQRM